MYNTDIEFQFIFFLASGLLFGGISRSLILSLIFIIVYEFYIFHISRFYPPKVRAIDRVLFNVAYIFGWILGRILMLNETGLEDIADRFDKLF